MRTHLYPHPSERQRIMRDALDACLHVQNPDPARPGRPRRATLPPHPCASRLAGIPPCCPRCPPLASYGAAAADEAVVARAPPPPSPPVRPDRATRWRGALTHAPPPPTPSPPPPPRWMAPSQPCETSMTATASSPLMRGQPRRDYGRRHEQQRKNPKKQSAGHAPRQAEQSAAPSSPRVQPSGRPWVRATRAGRGRHARQQRHPAPGSGPTKKRKTARAAPRGAAARPPSCRTRHNRQPSTGPARSAWAFPARPPLPSLSPPPSPHAALPCPPPTRPSCPHHAPPHARPPRPPAHRPPAPCWYSAAPTAGRRPPPRDPRATRGPPARRRAPPP